MQQGGHFGGYALGVKDGRPFFAYNVLALSTTEWDAPAAIGRRQAHDRLHVQGRRRHRERRHAARCSSTARPSRSERMEATIPVLVPIDEGFSVLRSNVTPVSHDYTTPFDFNGTLHELVINRVPPTLTPDAARQARRRTRRGLGDDRVARY